jgi:iron-sulfur cluster repair protein YtfE (RIC family)
MEECGLDTPVPDWVIEHPAALAMFEELGLDYSCGGKSLAYTCEERGVNAHEVLQELQRRIGRRPSEGEGHAG